MECNLDVSLYFILIHFRLYFPHTHTTTELANKCRIKTALFNLIDFIRIEVIQIKHRSVFSVIQLRFFRKKNLLVLSFQV